jgi:hypothetical protein
LYGLPGYKAIILEEIAELKECLATEYFTTWIMT